jgi:hypothetical protein
MLSPGERGAWRKWLKCCFWRVDAAPSFAAGVPEFPPDRGRGPYGLRAGAITVDVAAHWRIAQTAATSRLALYRALSSALWIIA